MARIATVDSLPPTAPAPTCSGGLSLTLAAKITPPRSNHIAAGTQKTGRIVRLFDPMWRTTGFAAPMVRTRVTLEKGQHE